MKFSPAFIDAHKRLAPAIPIKRFAAIVNPASIGLSSPQDFYAPVRFSVQASGKANDATGVIRLDVAVQKNPDWLRDMKDQLASTLGLSNVSSSLELRTVTGMPLERVPIEQLHLVGKLSIYNNQTDKPIRLSTLPQVPPEYRVTKVQELKQWANQLAQGKMADTLAAVLKGKDAYQLEKALLSDGEMMEAIQTNLSSSKQDWAEFVRLHQSSSTRTPKPVESQELLQKVSKQILTYINRFIGAASQQVNEHLRAQELDKLGGFKPVLSSVSGSPVKQNPTLYRNLIEDALSMPMLQKSLVSSVYNFSASSPSSSSKNKLVAASRPLMKRIASPSNHHPWFAHIHHTLLPLKGTYPSDYLVRHTKQDMSARAPYIGDVQKTYEAYHRFSGISDAPPPCKIKQGVLIECGHSKKGKKNGEKDVEASINGEIRSTPNLVPINGELRSTPNLVPINGELPKLIPLGSNIKRELPKLVPIGCHGKCEGEECEKVDSSISIKGGMPPLIPINADLSKRSLPNLVPINGELPKLIPLGSNIKRELPKLVPIESDIQRELPKLVPIESDIQRELPKLVPIGCHGKCEGEECEKVDSSISIKGGMPPLIPINADLPKRSFPIESDLPKVNMPPLIPIQGHYPHHDKKHHSKHRSRSPSPVNERIGRNLPKLTPIEGHHHGKKHHHHHRKDRHNYGFEEERAAIGSDLYNVIGYEDTEAPMQNNEFAHLPDVDDVFGK